MRFAVYNELTHRADTDKKGKSGQARASRDSAPVDGEDEEEEEAQALDRIPSAAAPAAQSGGPGKASAFEKALRTMLAKQRREGQDRLTYDLRKCLCLIITKANK